MTFYLDMPLSETKVIKHFSPSEQPDVNRIKSIIDTSLTKKAPRNKACLAQELTQCSIKFFSLTEEKTVVILSLCNSSSPLHVH